MRRNLEKEIFSSCQYIFKSLSVTRPVLNSCAMGRFDSLHLINQCMAVLGRFISSELNQGLAGLKSSQLQCNV